jgi:L-lactate dehydrogenase (cytochrome)
VDDVRAAAARRVPKAVFDYVDGAAELELSAYRSRAAFDGLEFHPRVLRDVSRVSTETTLLGVPAAMPLALAPTGFTRMMHYHGEPAAARAAARSGIPYALSTMGTTSPEALAAVEPAGARWFQLYLWQDRGRSKELVARAAEAGYAALVVTVDVPVAGARLRDVRHGLTIPPTLRWSTLVDFARHPAWSWNLLTTEPLQFASFLTGDRPPELRELIAAMFDPAVTFADLDWLRSAWSGPLVVKGVQSVEDARAVVDQGADAVVVSNHGGRQLDRAVTPLALLPHVVDAIGDRAEVFMDGGVRSGADIAAAVALGARGCLVGRAYLYGLMAGGEAGVDRVLELLRAELVRTMQLLGARDVGELHRGLVSLPTGPV